MTGRDDMDTSAMFGPKVTVNKQDGRDRTVTVSREYIRGDIVTDLEDDVEKLLTALRDIASYRGIKIGDRAQTRALTALSQYEMDNKRF